MPVVLRRKRSGCSRVGTLLATVVKTSRTAFKRKAHYRTNDLDPFKRKIYCIEENIYSNAELEVIESSGHQSPVAVKGLNLRSCVNVNRPNLN